MHYIIYEKATGRPLFLKECSLKVDAEFGLPSNLGAAESTYLPEEVYVENELIFAKQPMQIAVDKVNIKKTESSTFTNIPLDSGIFVDRQYIGKVDSTGTFILEGGDLGKFIVRIVPSNTKFKTKEFEVNVT